MKKSIKGYCSYCYSETKHVLIESHKGLFKDIYRCKKCKNITVKCRFNKYCNGMARGKLELPKRKELGKGTHKISGYTKSHWNNLLCDEHNGRIASFANLSIKLKNLDEYEKIFVRKRKNVKKLGSYVVFIVGGAVVGGPLGAKIAPELAVALGSTGALGTCMTTPTLISSLYGAALTSASVAAIGSAGVMIITAAGAALGGALGGAISNSYFGSVKDFKIKQ